MQQSYRHWWKFGLLLGLLALPLATQAQQTASQIPNPTLPALHVAGNQLLDLNNQVVKLRGLAIPDLEYVAKYRDGGIPAAINRITTTGSSSSAFHSRVVRLPVYPEPQGLPIDGWLANPDHYFSTYLQPAIQHCISRKVYCIIDWHWVSDYVVANNPSRTAYIQAATSAFWTRIAQAYPNHPNLLFELFNEPIEPFDWATWRATAQPWIKMIDQYSPESVILVGAPHWSRDTSGALIDPFVGENIVYTSHIYPQHTRLRPTTPVTPTQQQDQWQAWFGNTAEVYPVMLTEFGWDVCDADPDGESESGCSNEPIVGTTPSFGSPFRAFVDQSAVVGWTAWVADYCLGPVTFDYDWNVLGGNAHQGKFIRTWLYQKRTEFFPTPIGTGQAVPPFNVAPSLPDNC
ncbi:glycoside hydrolase family 5 protein [Herpetosiphon llansteffanensis]